MTTDTEHPMSEERQDVEGLTPMPEWERVLALALIATKSGSQGPEAMRGNVVVGRLDLLAAMDEITALREQVESLQHKLGAAAREIPEVAGPVDHRIRMIRASLSEQVEREHGHHVEWLNLAREHAARADTLQRENEALRAAVRELIPLVPVPAREDVGPQWMQTQAGKHAAAVERARALTETEGGE